MRQRFRKYIVAIFLSTAWTASASAVDANFLSTTNSDRAVVAVAALNYNSALNAAAAAKLADMQAKSYWAHVSPDGHDAGYFVDSSGYPWVAWAENLAEGYSSSTAIVAAWMNSSGHRTNMLNANYRDVGFALGTATINGQPTIVSIAIYGSTIRGATAPVATPKTATPVFVPAAKTVALAPSAAVVATPLTQAAPTARGLSPSPATATASKHVIAAQLSNTANLTKGVQLSSPADNFVGILAVIFIVFGSLGLVFLQFLPKLAGRS